jgi:hypothetical protein
MQALGVLVDPCCDFGPLVFEFTGKRLIQLMVASWRMPTPKQMEKLAAEAARRPAPAAAAPDVPLPAEYWDGRLGSTRS